jgi:hypothetical protein
VFYLKLGLILVAVGVLLSMRRHVRSDALPARLPARVKLLAAGSLLWWASAIVAGRLLAYTSNRLTAAG